MGAADGFGAGFGHAEVPDLAFLDELLDGSCGVFNGDVEVDAVLVEEVDGIDAETAERGFRHLADVLGAAVEFVPLAAIIGIGLKSQTWLR